MLHATVNIVRRMQAATAMLLVAALNTMWKIAFNNCLEALQFACGMQHVAVLPQWNTAFSACVG